MTPTQAVLSAEADRYRAMVEGNIDRLRSMCEPALRYVQPSGDLLVLDAWLKKISAGELRYARIEHPVDRVEIHGDVAIVCGRVHAFGERDGQVSDLTLRSLSVLRRHDAGWRLLAFQATSMS